MSDQLEEAVRELMRYFESDRVISRLETPKLYKRIRQALSQREAQGEEPDKHRDRGFICPTCMESLPARELSRHVCAKPPAHSEEAPEAEGDCECKGTKRVYISGHDLPCLNCVDNPATPAPGLEREA